MIFFHIHAIFEWIKTVRQGKFKRGTRKKTSAGELIVQYILINIL